MIDIERKSNIEKVKVTCDTSSERIEVLVANIGFAWSGVSVTDTQVDMIISALQEYKLLKARTDLKTEDKERNASGRDF